MRRFAGSGLTQQAENIGYSFGVLMPTISELPATSQVAAADQLPISQGGTARSVSVGTLLAGTQPAIRVATGSLLGRTSLGPGGPDPVEVGVGLLLNSDALVATGADHAKFSAQSTLTLSDEVVLSSEGTPKLLQLALLRNLFCAGSNIAIDQRGTISAALQDGGSDVSSEYSITNLPTITTISADDRIAISHAGLDRTIAHANLIDGQTIDQAQVASPTSGTDSFLIAQGGNVMLRQTMAAVWVWLCSQLPSYQTPTLEIATGTSLNSTAHNGRILICSQPISLTAVAADLGSGFICTLINVSGGNVTFDGGVTSSSGTSTLSPGQAATLTCTTYSGGSLVYAWMTATTPSINTP